MAYSSSLWIVCLMTAHGVVGPWHKGPRCPRGELFETELLLVNTMNTEPGPGRALGAWETQQAQRCRDAHRMHAWMYVSSLGVRLHLCFFACAYVCVTSSRWWIGMFLFPLDPPDRSSILKQFGSALRAWEGWEKRWATQLTVALMKDSLEAPGNQEASGFTVWDGWKNNMLSGTGGHWCRRTSWDSVGNKYRFGWALVMWGRRLWHLRWSESEMVNWLQGSWEMYLQGKFDFENRKMS